MNNIHLFVNHKGEACLAEVVRWVEAPYDLIRVKLLEKEGRPLAMAVRSENQEWVTVEG